MNIFNLTQKSRSIDDEVTRLLTEISNMNVEDDTYAKALKNLSVLMEAKSQKTPTQISADTVVMAATSIVSILIVLNYEQLGVITSKTFGMIPKGRM